MITPKQYFNDEVDGLDVWAQYTIDLETKDINILEIEVNNLEEQRLSKMFVYAVKESLIEKLKEKIDAT